MLADSGMIYAYSIQGRHEPLDIGCPSSIEPSFEQRSGFVQKFNENHKHQFLERKEDRPGLDAVRLGVEIKRESSGCSTNLIYLHEVAEFDLLVVTDGIISRNPRSRRLQG
jgi:hypothetical protein